MQECHDSLTGRFPLAGVFDIHAETASLETMRRAIDLGLRCVVLKWPGGPDSTLTAAAFESFFKGGQTRFLGGVCLDLAVGGLNPVAVDTCAQWGGRIVWMPTVDARLHRRRNGPEGRPVVNILAADGSLLPELERVLERVAHHGLVLGTGHLDIEEVSRLIPAARGKGVRKMILNHPLLLDFPLDVLDELTRDGDVLVEHCYIPDHEMKFDVGRIAEAVETLGCERNLIADFGDYGREANIADALVAWGMDAALVSQLASDLPRRLFQM